MNKTSDKSDNSETALFILSLKENKYFIGKSTNIYSKIKKYFRNEGPEWIQKYKPLHVERVIEDINPSDIDKYVRIYMYHYGIDSVRGGSYLNEEINLLDKNQLKKEIWLENNCCTRCGYNNHQIDNCYARRDMFGEKLKDINCYRCGRLNHTVYECEAKVHINGDIIDSDYYVTSDSESD